MIYHDISAISSWRKMLDDQLSKSDAGKSSISMELTNIFDFSTCRKILRMQILKKNSCFGWNFVKVWSAGITGRRVTKEVTILGIFHPGILFVGAA